MSSLLIVDDEMDQVDSLADTIDWSACGIGPVYKAYSAYEALDVMEMHAVDIVVTDIRMPEMNGLELIQRMIKHGAHIQVIILSGYSDFQYAQAAVKYNVSEYLLKPVSDDEITEAVIRTRDKLSEIRSSYLSHQKQRQFIQQNLPIIKSSLLNEMLGGKKLQPFELDDLEAAYGIRFSDGDRLRLLLLRLEGKFTRYNNHDKALIVFSIFNMAEELLGGEFELWYTQESFGYLAILLKPKQGSAAARNNAAEMQKWIAGYAEKLQRAVQFYLQGNISVLVSGSFVFQDELQKVYRGNLAAFRDIIGELDQIVVMGSGYEEGQADKPLQKLYESFTLTQLMELGKWEQAREKLNDTVQELLEKWPNSRGHLLEAFYAFSHAVIQFLHSNGLKLSQLEDAQEQLSGKGIPFHSARQFQEWALSVLDQLQSLAGHSRLEGRSSIVQTINQYIEAHYGEDSTLQALSDYVGLHPSYLSKLYKSETGQGISEYRHQLRMAKAVELLQQNRLKIHEISETLGFQNPQYFSKKFKEEFGCTPNEYRDHRVE